jgi:hypothetical protein
MLWVAFPDLGITSRGPFLKIALNTGLNFALSACNSETLDFLGIPAPPEIK